MTAILATSGAIRTLVDGTLRISFDVEPKDAADAFAMFGKPGSPAALARITNEAAVEHDRKAQAQPPAEPLERKPMALASKVALTCGEQSFHHFLAATCKERWLRAIKEERASRGPSATAADIAAAVVREVCGVASRSSIKPDTDAAKSWFMLEAGYHHWQRTGEAA